MSFDDARRRLDELLRELAPDIGPARHSDGKPAEGDIAADTNEDLEPVPGVLLTDWVLIAAWVDPVDPEPFVVRLCSQDLASYRRHGLLLTALERMD